MEKNTVIAFILFAVIIAVGSITMGLMEDPNPPVGQDFVETQPENVSKNSEDIVLEENVDTTVFSAELPEQNYYARTIVEETDLYKIVFNTVGGVASEINLLYELDEGQPIPMVLDKGSGIGAFNVAFGGPETPYLMDVFNHERIQRGREIIHNFSRIYALEGQQFSLTKSYRIIPGEYLIELILIFETPDGRALPQQSNEIFAYTLTYGPQIGPDFEKIDGRYEIRENVSWGPDARNKRMKREKQQNRSKLVQSSDIFSWVGVVGKYFAVIVDPGSGDNTITWDGRPSDGLEEPSRIQISRPYRRQSKIEDTYRFYVGPLKKDFLIRYNKSADNAFGVAGMELENAPRSSSWLGWLESILRFLLEIFYSLIPNYGVAIILLTVLVKVILFPFTRKSYESTSRMQEIQPKLKDIQEQYKDDPQKRNAKTAELYKSEGVNPMGGCLPMLFQFPIFIALYGLLNRYFPLRGAIFIPGWITDLSAPEYIWREFTQPINLLITSIPAIRILPMLYLGGQLLMTKVTQQGPTGSQSGMQQKMMTVGMPVMFFFILYNMASGLLLYWTAMNFITIGQQLITNYFKKRHAAGGAI